MQPIDVTFVAAAYNAENFLEDFFASLKAQSYQGFQLVLVDDASSDATFNRAQGLGGFLGERMTILRNHKNVGLVATRNAGLDWAAAHPTKYLAFLDADDCFEEDYLLDLYTMAEATNVDLCIAGIERFRHADGRTLATEMVHIEPFLVEDTSSCDALAFVNPCSYAKLFRFEPLGQLRFRNVLRSEDTCYLFDALPTLHGVAFTNKALYHYRVHDQALSAAVGRVQHESMHKMFADMLPTFAAADKLPFKDMFETQVFIRSSIGAVLRRVDAGEDAALLAREERLWLDAHMPSWRTNPYLNGGAAGVYSSKSLALQACAQLYKAHAASVFVHGYRLLRDALGMEVRV